MKRMSEVLFGIIIAQMLGQSTFAAELTSSQDSLLKGVRTEFSLAGSLIDTYGFGVGWGANPGGRYELAIGPTLMIYQSQVPVQKILPSSGYSLGFQVRGIHWVDESRRFGFQVGTEMGVLVSDARPRLLLQQTVGTTYRMGAHVLLGAGLRMRANVFGDSVRSSELQWLSNRALLPAIWLESTF